MYYDGTLQLVLLDEHPHLNYTMRLELDHAPEIGRRRAENEISAAH